jgi:hypothetical protein
MKRDTPRPRFVAGFPGKPPPRTRDPSRARLTRPLEAVLGLLRDVHRRLHCRLLRPLLLDPPVVSVSAIGSQPSSFFASDGSRITLATIAADSDEIRARRLDALVRLVLAGRFEDDSGRTIASAMPTDPGDDAPGHGTG